VLETYHSVYETCLCGSYLLFDSLGSFEKQQNITKHWHLRSWRTNRFRVVSGKASAVISDFSFLFLSFKARLCSILLHDFAADIVHVIYQTLSDK